MEHVRRSEEIQRIIAEGLMMMGLILGISECEDPSRECSLRIFVGCSRGAQRLLKPFIN